MSSHAARAAVNDPLRGKGSSLRLWLPLLAGACGVAAAALRISELSGRHGRWTDYVAIAGWALFGICWLLIAGQRVRNSRRSRRAPSLLDSLPDLDIDLSNIVADIEAGREER